MSKPQLSFFVVPNTEGKVIVQYIVSDVGLVIYIHTYVLFLNIPR
jgi:hypothetical protein